MMKTRVDGDRGAALAAPQIFLVSDGAGDVTGQSAGWRLLTGQGPAAALKLGWLDAVHPDDRARTIGAWRDGIASGSSFRLPLRLWQDSKNTYRATEARLSPILGTGIETNGWMATFISIDRIDDARPDLANASRNRFKTLVEGVPQLVWRAVGAGQWTWSSPQWAGYTGQAEPASHGMGWLEPVHPDDRERTMTAWRNAAANGEFSVEFRLKDGASGHYRWFQTRARPLYDDTGFLTEWLGTSTDIDDLRLLQDRQRLLLAELQHRVRNILAVVRSVFSRTVEAGGALEDIADHFRGRLDSLARTQVVVTQSATGTVDLENLIRDELLSVGASDGPNIRIDGPQVSLDPRMAEPLGLAIHELTTNAVKYGALKAPGARLEICWATNMVRGEGRRLNLRWTEQGVPAVPVQPGRYGFGIELIEEALPFRLGADTSVRFRGGGIECAISVPLREGEASSPQEGRRA